jgi:hypothetical protein
MEQYSGGGSPEGNDNEQSKSPLEELLTPEVLQQLADGTLVDKQEPPTPPSRETSPLEELLTPDVMQKLADGTLIGETTSTPPEAPAEADVDQQSDGPSAGLDVHPPDQRPDA